VAHNHRIGISNFRKWLLSSSGGDKYSYARGKCAALGSKKYAPIKHEVRKAYTDGLVHPVQKRHAEDDYEYLAIRSDRA